MSSNGTKEALSHLLLAGTTLWCVFHTDKQDFKWVHVSYGSLCIYSLLGLWRHGNPRYGDDASEAYATSMIAQECLTLPCITADLYIDYGYEWRIASIHSVLPMLPLSLYLARGEINQEFMDLMITLNSVSMGALSVMQENYYGVVAAVNYFINHFVLRLEDFEHIPRVVIYNIGLSFYAYFSFRALAEGHVKV